jgi:hypothetical protein
MANTINSTSLDAFRKFVSARTDISSDAENVKKPAVVAIQSTVAHPPAAVAPVSNYVKVLNLKKDETKEELKSRMLANDPITKFKVNMKKIGKLPEYVHRGLKGDPDSNFYEALNIANIPYYVGGPMLVGTFAAGKTLFNKQSAMFADMKTRQMAVGVALYYLGVALAQKVVDLPVRLFRGIDLDHPYENVVPGRVKSATGHYDKKVELHKVPESVDFTRWDLMYGDESTKNGKIVNEKFDKLAAKFGVDKNLADSDTTLKGKIKALIVSATACKYMLAAPFVALGISLSVQKKENGDAIWANVGNGVKAHMSSMFGLKKDGRYQIKFEPKLGTFWQMFKENVSQPMGESFKALWGSKVKPNKVGRALILTSAIAPILANIRILQLSSAKDYRFVDAKEYIHHGKKKPASQGIQGGNHGSN